MDSNNVSMAKGELDKSLDWETVDDVDVVAGCKDAEVDIVVKPGEEQLPRTKIKTKQNERMPNFRFILISFAIVKDLHGL
jgi:hypothetical protein